MSYIRSTYNSGVVTSSLDSSELASSQNKYWSTQDGVSNTVGVWDDDNNKFIPDGLYDNDTGWLWPEGLTWE